MHVTYQAIKISSLSLLSSSESNVEQFLCNLECFMTLGHPVPQFFYVSVPEKLKIVATRGEIFRLKFTKYRLAAGLRPDPLGELERSPRPLAAIGGRGAYL